MRTATPETSGASQFACRLANAVLAIDAFRPLLDRLAPDYDAAALYASVARRIDAELNEVAPMNSPADQLPTRPTAAYLNDTLLAGGEVMVTTYTRATIYSRKHAGWFAEGGDGNLYVRHGRGRNCLSAGNRLVVAVRIRRVTP